MNHVVKVEDSPCLRNEMVLLKLAWQLVAETFSYLVEEIEGLSFCGSMEKKEDFSLITRIEVFDIGIADLIVLTWEGGD